MGRMGPPHPLPSLVNLTSINQGGSLGWQHEFLCSVDNQRGGRVDAVLWSKGIQACYPRKMRKGRAHHTSSKLDIVQRLEGCRDYFLSLEAASITC